MGLYHHLRNLGGRGGLGGVIEVVVFVVVIVGLVVFRWQRRALWWQCGIGGGGTYYQCCTGKGAGGGGGQLVSTSTLDDVELEDSGSRWAAAHKLRMIHSNLPPTLLELLLVHVYSHVYSLPT